MKHSEETKKKISNKLKGVLKSEEHRKNNKTSLGKHWKLSEKTKKKMSEVRLKRKQKLGYINSEETRKKIAISNTNPKQEIREKLRKSHLGQIAWNKGIKGNEFLKHYPNGIKGGGKKGHCCSEETKKKISIANSKENNGMWSGGISYEPYTLEFNNVFKNRIRTRDGWKCMLCNKPKNEFKKHLHVHHIDYNKRLSIPENCITLCHKCHPKTNKNRKYWINLFQNMLYDRYQYTYLIERRIF